MDVRCERCQTEYELEDANVSDLGTEVQCSDCGHRFVVKRPSGGGEEKASTSNERLPERLPETTRLEASAVTPAPVGLVAAPSAVMPTPLPRPATAASPAVASPTVASPPMPVPGDSLGGVHLGAFPQASDPGETEIIRIASRNSRGALRLILTMLVAAVVAYGVIVWQHQRLRSAMISSSGTSEDDSVRNQAPATTGEATPRAAAKDFEPPQSPDPNDSVAPRGPLVEPMAEGGRVESGARGGKKAMVARKARPVPGHASRPNVQASRAQPGAPEAVAAQGYAALTHRQYGQAVVLFKRALAGSPSNGTALFGLAEAYRESGQRMSALQTYRRYVEAFPAGPNAIAARTQVRLLEGKKR